MLSALLSLQRTGEALQLLREAQPPPSLIEFGERVGLGRSWKSMKLGRAAGDLPPMFKKAKSVHELLGTL